jgi:hypothetical protein
LALLHQHARRRHSDAVPGKAKENAQAQEMAEQFQHGFLMRCNMAGVNSLQEPIGLQALILNGAERRRALHNRSRAAQTQPPASSIHL